MQRELGKGTTNSVGSNYYKPPAQNDWNNVGSETSPLKGSEDPCPNGWRLPTKTELEQVLSLKNNSIKHVGHYQANGKNPMNGLFIGEYLFLSSCGYTDWNIAIEKPSVMQQGKDLGYWTSSWIKKDGNTPYVVRGQMFNPKSISLKPAGLVVGRGYPIRCVADQ